LFFINIDGEHYTLVNNVVIMRIEIAKLKHNYKSGGVFIK